MTNRSYVLSFVIMVAVIGSGRAEVHEVAFSGFEGGTPTGTAESRAEQVLQTESLMEERLLEQLDQLSVVEAALAEEMQEEVAASAAQVLAEETVSQDIDLEQDRQPRRDRTQRRPLQPVQYSAPPAAPQIDRQSSADFGPMESARVISDRAVAPVRTNASAIDVPMPPAPSVPETYPTDVDINAVYSNIYGPESSCGWPSLCGCSPSGCRVWFRGDVLLWWLQGYETPALVTTSPLGTDPALIGLPDSSTTLFGDSRFGDDLRVGGRVRGGWWLDSCRRFGIDGEFFGLGGADDDFTRSSAGDPILARPFYNSNPAVNGPDAEILAADGIATGAIDYHTSSQIYSAAALLRANLCCCQAACESSSKRLDVLLGYRYFHLGESLSSFETFTPTSAFFVPGTFYELSDSFDTRNDFHGAELGLHYQNQRGRFIVEVGGRVALGQTTREVTVDGSSRAVVPGIMDATVPGGFLSSGTQLGTYRDREFGVLPQTEVTLGYYLTPRLRFNVGYNFFYLNNVVRPGPALPAIDSSTFLSGTGSTPIDIEAVDQGVWLQGVSLGLTFNF